MKRRWIRVGAALGVTGTVLLATVATLLVAFALKSSCLTDWPSKHQPKTCYNDVQSLWYQRHMAVHAAPYQGTVNLVHENGHLVAVHLGAGQIEYPALTGLFAWLVSLPAHSAATYFVLTAIALSPFALLTGWALGNVAGRRALLFALSPQLAAYAFLNWDLLSVAATALALWAWYRRRPALAAALLSAGAWAKIWPGFVLLPMLVTLLLERKFRAAGRSVTAFVAVSVAVNLPFLLIDPRGWAAPYLAQSVRVNDGTTNSFWYWIFRPHDFGPVSFWSTLAVLVVWAYALVAGWRHRRRDGVYPAVQAAGAMIAGYIAVGRVDSPQYGLWLLPFLVVLQVPPRWLLAFAASDIWLWLIWSWLWGTPKWFHMLAVVVRPLVLLGLVAVFMRSSEAEEVEERATRTRTTTTTTVSSGVAT